jgi:hypothetical protein
MLPSMASPDQLPPSPRPGSPASEQWDKLSSSDSELFSVNASDKPDPPNKDVISDWTSAVSIENSQPPRAVLLSDEQHAYVRELLGEEDLNNLDSVDSISVACTQKVHEAVTNSQRSIWQEIRRLQESFLRENLETEMLLLQIKTTEKKLESKDEQITTLQHRVEVLEQTQSKQGASIDKVSALIRQTIVNETKRSVEINSLRNKIANLEAARQTQEKYMNSRDISIRISIESIEKSQEKQMRIAQSTSNQLDKTSKDHRAWIENMDGKVGQLEDKFMDYAAREQNFCHYLPGALEVYANNVKNHTHDAMSSIAKKFEDRVKIVEGLNKQKVQQADEEQSSQDSLHIHVLKVCVNNLADKVHDCQKYTTHIESNSYEAHQNLQLTIQGIEKKIHDVEGNVGLWRSVAYEMERKVKQLGEDIAAQAKQASSNDSKTDQSSNTCPALGAGYMPMWQHIRNLEKAIVEHSESMDIDLVTRELTALRDCCNMHANVLFNVREDIGDLYEKVQSLRPSPSGPTPIDEDISGAMAVDLSNRLNVVEEQVKEIAPSQERCETQGQLGSGKTGIHLTERVSKAEQRLTVVEAQFRDIDLKQTSSKSDIQALQKESEAQHVKIDGYHQVFDKTAKMTKTLASLRKKTASHGKDIDGNNEACKSGNNAAHARIDDVSVWEDGVKMQVNALFSKIHGLETRIECHEKANRIEAVRRKIPVLTTTALTSMRHDPLVRDKAFNRIKEIMDDGAKDEMETAIRTTGELHKSAVEKGGLEELYKEYTNGRQDRTSTINSSKAPEEAFSKMAPNAGVKVPVGLKNAAQDLASKSFQDGINPSSPAIVDLNSTSKLSKLSKNIRQEIERTNAYNKKQYGSCKIEETETETDGVKEEPAHELSKDKCFNPGFSEDQMVQTEEGIRQHITRRKAAGIEQEPLMSTTGGEEDVTSGEVEAGAKEASKQGEVEKTPQQPIINYSTSYAPSEQEWLSIKSKARELMANVTPELTKHILMKFKAMDISRQAEILEKYHQDPVWGYCMQAAVQRFMDNREARRKMQVAAKAVLSDQERSSESKIQAAPQVATEAGDVREQSLTLDKKGVGSAPQSTEEMIADAQRLAAQKARLSNFTPTPSTEPTKVAAKHSESFDAALEEADKPKMDE